MCLIGFALGAHPDWPLVIAANRDEFHARPTAPAHRWSVAPSAANVAGSRSPDAHNDVVIGGRDLQAGGSWFALRTGPSGRWRLAALTNVRPGLRGLPCAQLTSIKASTKAATNSPVTAGELRSRGHLVTDVLGIRIDPRAPGPARIAGSSPSALGPAFRYAHHDGVVTLDAFDDDVEPAIRSVTTIADDVDGFNLLVFDGRCDADPIDAWHVGNIAGPAARRIDPGIHTLSNATLDTPWPKSVRLHAAIRAVLGQADGSSATFEALSGALFEALSDRRVASAHELPFTGLDAAREALLSSVFIVDPAYGTRCSTVFALDSCGRWWFDERRFGIDGAQDGHSVLGG